MSTTTDSLPLRIESVSGLRTVLWECGFRPVPIFSHDHPVKDAGKRPLGDDWGNAARQDPPLCTTARAVAHALNTGILCDGLRPIDVDIDDRDVAYRVYTLAQSMFGEAPMRYRDDSARVTVLYRAAVGAPPKRSIASDLGKIEVLGKGQQFVAFGYHPAAGAQLRWMPEAPGDISCDELEPVSEEQITEFLTKAAAIIGAAPPRSVETRERPQTSGKLGADPLQVVAALSAIPNNGPADWEAWNRIGMATWAATNGGEAGRAAFHAWSQQHPSYDPDETNGRWDHYSKSPPTSIGAGTLFYMARAARPTQQEEPDIGPEPPPYDGEEFAAEGPAETHQTTATRATPLWADADGWNEAEIEVRPWVVRGFLLRGSVTVLAGQGSAGKSSVSVCQSIALALCKPFGSFRPLKPGRSIVYNTEDDASEQRRRYSASLRQFRAAPADLAGRVIRTGPTHIGTLIERDAASGHLRLTEAMGALVAMIQEFRPDALYLDPLVELHTAEENDNTALRAIIAQFRSLAVAYEMAVVIIHHAKKGVAGGAGDPDTVRGAGAIVGAARVVLTVTTMTEDEAAKCNVRKEDRHDYFRMDGAKTNYSRIGEPEWFFRTQYELANGETVSAPIPWKPTSVFKELTDEDCNRALDRIHAGFRPGEPFTASKRGAGNHRWAGYAIADELGLSEEQAANVLGTWLRNGLLHEEDYRDRSEGKTRKGVFVDHSKRPGRSA